MKSIPNVVIVNDCAHVMEDMIPYLSDFNVKFIRHGRGLWSKTFGILWKILRSNGDVYHVSYALQDAYFVAMFKHLDVLHVHGSDVRWVIDTRKYGWIVRSNLKYATKILYATPDLEPLVVKTRPNAMYLPTPVKTNMFTPKHANTELKATYFALHYEKLPTELILALNHSNIPLTILESNIPYETIAETLQRFNIFIDRFTIPSFSKSCLEAMSCGLATIDYRHANTISQRVKELSDIGTVEEIGKLNRRFVEENHDAPKVAKQLSEVWKTLT